jgi:hypothetical protein
MDRNPGGRELVYSQQTTDYEAGKRYANPRFFNGSVRAGITHVILVGDWPAVADAYRRAGVKVSTVAPGAPLSEAKSIGDAPAPEAPSGGGEIDLTKVEIPTEEELGEMDWSDLRTKVKELGGTVTNKAQAIEFINAKRSEKDALPSS